MSDHDEPTLRDLLLKANSKLDTMLTSYRRVLRDRLKDRDTVQRHDRRIESLEHQVALLSQHHPSPSVPPWRANIQDLATGEHAAVEIAELDLETDDD